ncbi:MAG: hypothetical protein HQ546_06490 [Planctomycetes bacterium]|nr:hypothetical protein [Planctomycetota bacterium]
MDAHEKLQALLDLADQIGLAVRKLPYMDGDGECVGGALVCVKGREVLFLDARAAVADQLAVTAAALAGRDELENRYIPPELRDIIEERRVGSDG